ncbi:ATP-binding protein [Catenulispora yoronensis]
MVQARDVSGGIHYHVPAGPAVTVPRLLRADVAGFVGRDTELTALAGAVEYRGGLRLVVVTGTAGVGKTSLALRFAHRIRADFPGGDLFVNLRGYDIGPPLAPAEALERFLRALGVPGGDIPADLEDRAGMYRSLLAGRQVLVVLDNAATAGQVRPLLPGDERSLVVVTSRSRLSGLTARDGARRISVGLLDPATAADLYQAAVGEYRSLDDRGQVAELAELCARLPLALRIAAERAASHPLMPLQELIGELRSGSGLWQALSVDDGQEADAVRTVFAWSYRALPGSAARAFRLLGLHPGPEFGIGAAAALLGSTHTAARTMLDVLAGAHLLEQSSAVRFQFHDLLRAFAADSAEGDEPPTEREHALLRLKDWYLHTARAATALVENSVADVVDTPALPGVELESFADRRQAVDWYAVERHNLMALIRTLEQAQDHKAVFQLAATMYSLTFVLNASDDRIQSTQAALRSARASNDLAAQARALRNLAIAHRFAGNLEPALIHGQEALAAYDTLGDAVGSVDAANAVGLILMRRRDLDQALQVFNDATTRADTTGQNRMAAIMKINIADVLQHQGELSAAVETAEQALPELAAADYQGGMVLEAYGIIVRALTELGRFELAHQALDAADRDATVGADPGIQVVLMVDRAELALAEQRPAEAEDLLWQAQNLGQDLGNRTIQARVLTAAGRAQHMLGRPEQAADFHRQAVALLRTQADGYKTANALSHLADTLDTTDDGHGAGDATAARVEAARLAANYDDPRAIELRAHLQAGPHPPTTTQS